MISIALAEDHHIVRQGLKLLLKEQPDFQLMGECADGLEAVKFVEKTRPQILVLDLMIPRLHGLEVIRELKKRRSRTKVIVLSMHSDEPYVIEALRNGASGYVLKSSTGAELVKAIRKVADGKRFLSLSLSERAIERYMQKPGESADPCAKLTNRERLVMQLTAEGCSSTDIGKRLFISPRTAEAHRANLMRKIGVRSQTELVRFAIRKKIILP